MFCLDVNVEQEACPLKPGADVEHDGDAGAGRCAGDGAVGGARVLTRKISLNFIPEE